MTYDRQITDMCIHKRCEYEQLVTVYHLLMIESVNRHEFLTYNK
jgi:hypothetical protein